MSLTIELPPNLEEQIRSEAQRAGVDAAELVVRALREQFYGSEPDLGTLTDAELLQGVNEGLPASDWLEYQTLVRKRQDENLGEDEQARLIAISDRVEVLNARRMEMLAELARRRGKSLPGLMADLGIEPPPYA